MTMEKGKNAEKHYKTALELDTRGKHQTALDEYRLAAELGQAAAQVTLGEKYSDIGLWIPAFSFEARKKSLNPEQAAYWFHQAANQGNPFGMMGYGWCCFQGIGVPSDRNLGLDLLFQAEKTDVDGILDGWDRSFTQDWIGEKLIGLIYSVPLEKVIEKRIFKWLYTIDRDNGHPSYFQAYLGECYFLGFGTEINYADALKCYLRAVDEDSLKEDKPSASTVFPSCIHDPYNRIGYCYEMGLGTERNAEEAFWWYRVDAERGDNEKATRTLARCFEHGIGVARDLEKAAAISAIQSAYPSLDVGTMIASIISGRKTSHSELALPDGKIAYVMVLE